MRSLKPVNPEKIIKIIAHELPQLFEHDEGDYELMWGHMPKEKFYHDVISLSKELKTIIPERAEDILDKLQNFRKVFINLETGEIL